MKRLLPILLLVSVLAFAGTAFANQGGADTFGAFPGCFSISTGTAGRPESNRIISTWLKRGLAIKSLCVVRSFALHPYRSR